MARLIHPFGASAAAATLALVILISPAAAVAGPNLLGVLDLPPVGTADAYATPHQTELVVDAPGVLANDVDLDSAVLFARLVSSPANGTLTLETDGHFHYLPDSGFDGIDTFRYRPFDGVSEALLPATVSIVVARPIATPAPTPTPTPTPTPKPSPTPIPTPRPTIGLPPVPLPSVGLPTLPSPTLRPTDPIPTPGPTPFLPVASTDPASGPSIRPDATPRSSAQPGAGGVVTRGGGPSIRGASGVPPSASGVPPNISLPNEPAAGSITFGSFGEIDTGIEWIVPTLAFTVPGFLLILIGLAQGFGGFIWLPIARRWLRGDGRPGRSGTERGSPIPNRG